VEHKSVLTELEFARRRVTSSHHHVYHQFRQFEDKIRKNTEERDTIFGKDCRRLHCYKIALLMTLGSVAASTTTKEGKQAHLEDIISQAKFFRDIGCKEFDKLSSDMENYVNKMNHK
jgi:hypothetical protein